MKKVNPYIVINKRDQAINCDSKHKVIEGFLLGARHDVGKYKSSIYLFEDDKGESWSVWGNTAIDRALLDSKDHEVIKQYMEKWIRLTWLGIVKLRGRKNAYQDIEVSYIPNKKRKV
jgi:hypothetical protein